MKLSDELIEKIKDIAGCNVVTAALMVKALESIPNAHIVTVRDVYGTDEPKIPDGYERVDFRVPTRGDLYLNNSNGFESVTEALGDQYGYRPFLILRRRKVTRKQFILTETGEARVPKPGEWVITQWGDVIRVNSLSGLNYRILKYEEREIEVEA